MLGQVVINEYSASNLTGYLDNYDTSVLANRIEPFDNKLAVSDWDDVEILEWDGNNLNLIGYKNTTRRTMAIATKDNYIYCLCFPSNQESPNHGRDWKHVMRFQQDELVLQIRHKKVKAIFIIIKEKHNEKPT